MWNRLQRIAEYEKGLPGVKICEVVSGVRMEEESRVGVGGRVDRDVCFVPACSFCSFRSSGVNIHLCER